MLGGYQLAGAPLAGSGLTGTSWTKVLTEAIASNDVLTKVSFKTLLLTEGVTSSDIATEAILHVWTKLLTESLLSYDTYRVYNPNSNQERDNTTVNPRIKMGNTKPTALRFNVKEQDKLWVSRRNDLLRIDLKR